MRLIILFLLCSPLAGFSQHFIGKSKSHVKKELARFIQKNDSLNIILNDNDTTLSYSFRDKKVQPVDFIYEFDQSGKCRSERMIAGCDSCFNKYLTAALGEKKYGWKKINENQYISKYRERMMIELPMDNKDFSYTILHTGWSREQYDLLTGN